MLTHYYKSLPVFDEALNEQALRFLFLSPLLLFGFGYWFLSNKQLTSNDFLEPRIMASKPYDA